MSDVYVGGAKSALVMDLKPWLQGLAEGIKGLDDFYSKAAALFTKTDKSADAMGASVKKTFSGDMGMGKFSDVVQGFGQKIGQTFASVAQSTTTLSARFKSAFTPDAAAGLAQTGAQVTKFQQTFSQAAAQYAKDTKAFGDATKDWSKQVRGLGGVLAASGGTLTAGLALAGKQFLDFNKSMRNTNSIAKESEPIFAQTSESVRRLAVELKTGQGVQGFAQSLYDINSSGFQGAAGLQMLRLSAVGAKAGLTDIHTVSEGLGQALNSYGKSIDAAEHFQDVFFNTIDKGVITAEQLYSNLGQVTSLAASSKVPIEELGAAIAVMTQRGAKPTAAMTGLRQLIYKLASPGKDARKILHELGYQMDETALETQGLTKVLQGLFKATGGRKELLAPILGSDEAVTAATQLMGQDMGKLMQERMKENMAGAGSTARAFAEQMKAAQQPLDEIRTNLEAFFIGVGRGAVEAFGPAILMGRDFTRMLADLSPTAQRNVGAVGAVAGGVLTLSGALLLAAPNLAALPAGLKVLGSGVNLVLTPIRALAAGMGAIPFALVIAGVAALATAWAKDWGGIREAAAQGVVFVGQQLEELSSWLATNVGSWRDWKNLASAAFGAVSRFYKSELLPIFQDWRRQWEEALPFVRAFGEGVKLSLAVVQTSFRVAWDVASKVLELIGRSLASTIQIWWKLIKGDWQGAWDQFVETIRAILPRLVQAARELADTLVAELSGLPGKMIDAGKRAAQGFIDGFRGKQPAMVGPELFRGFGGPTGGGALSGMAASARQSVLKQVMPWLAKAGSVGSAGLARLGAMGSTPGPVRNVPTWDEVQAGIAADSKRGRASQKKAPLTRSQMLAFINQNASVSGNLGGLDDKTVAATYRLIDNAVNNKVRLAITSAFRSNSNTFHGAGMAIDLAATNLPRNVAPEAIRRLAQNTGFRSGINEYDPAARAWTGGTGDHVHLTTGMERLGNTGVFALDGKVRKGAQDLMGDLEKYKAKLIEFSQQLTSFVDKPANQFDKQREAVRKQLAELQKDAAELGLPKAAMEEARKAAAERIAKINEDEKKTVARTLAEITLLRLEAEGKAGEAARARITASTEEEKQKLQELLKLYPQLRDQVAQASAALDQSAQRQTTGLSLQDASSAFGSGNAIADFQRQDAGMAALMGQFPQFAAQVQAAYSAIQAYVQNPAEATRSLFEQARGFLDQLGQSAEAQQQKKLEAIDYERALGQITRDEALARQAEVLNSWVGGEESKRAIMLEMVDAYRENFEQQLDMQGEFNESTLQGFVDSLTQMQTLTLAQQAQLAAANQLIMQQRMQDQQTWQGVLQQGLGNFQSFLTGVLTGQQTFSQGFTQLWKGIANQIIGEIVRMIVKATILQKILSSIFGFFGGILGVGGGAVGGATDFGASLAGSLHTGGFIGPGGGIQSFHTGGMVGWGGGLGMSLRGDEIMAKLQTGEYVMSREQVQNLNNSPLNGGGSSTVNQVTVDKIYIQQPGESPEQVGLRIGRGINSAMQGMAY